MQIPVNEQIYHYFSFLPPWEIGPFLGLDLNISFLLFSHLASQGFPKLPFLYIPLPLVLPRLPGFGPMAAACLVVATGKGNDGLKTTFYNSSSENLSGCGQAQE